LTDSLVVGASAIPAALDCPERDGVLYNTNGTAFQIECGTDRDRTFLEPGYTATFRSVHRSLCCDTRMR